MGAWESLVHKWHADAKKARVSPQLAPDRRQSVARSAAAALIAGGLSLVTSLAHGQIVETPIAEDPIAIDSGAVSGKVLAFGVKAYFGIPYAAAPIGRTPSTCSARRVTGPLSIVSCLVR